MFGSTVLEIAIGMAFLFSFFSLITTAANELLSAWISLRSKNLAEAIERLIGEDYANEVYAHPLINGLAKDGQKPSYVPPKLFVAVLLHTIHEKNKDAATIEDAIEKLDDTHPLNKTLKVLAKSASKELGDFHTNVERWFNSAMERASGWYKRRVQLHLLVISIVGTIVWNVDSEAIIGRLSVDSALRDSIVKRAEAFQLPAAQTNQPASLEEQFAARQKQFTNLVTELDSMQLPIGWIDATNATPLTAGLVKPKCPTEDRGESLIATIKIHWLGWAITVLAVSLGAPFWFDLLNKFVNIRAVGKAPEEYPKKPKMQPQPSATV